MKRQTKLNKYLAGPRVNRRQTAQLKRNAHNRAILQEVLGAEALIRISTRREKNRELSNPDLIKRISAADHISLEDKANLEFIAADESPICKEQIESEGRPAKTEFENSVMVDGNFEDVSEEFIDVEFDEHDAEKVTC